jgi:hypothetical protein
MPTYPAVPCYPYPEVRHRIQSGDILLCSGSSPWSRLIQRATGSRWSHVGILYWVTAMDRLIVLESVESRGVQIAPVSQYVSNYNETDAPYPGRIFLARHLATTALGAVDWVRFGQFTLDAQLKRYNTRELGAIAFALVFGDRDADGTPEPDALTAKRYICSEFAAACLQAAGVVIPWNPRGYIAPADFAEDPAVTILWEIATA